MGTRKFFDKYYETSDNSIKTGSAVSAAYDTLLTSNSCWNYSRCRRNVLCYTLNVSGNSIALPGPATDEWEEWFSIPIADRVVAPGKLYVWFLYEGTSEQAANNVLFDVQVGTARGQNSGTNNGNKAWIKVELDLTADVFSGYTKYDRLTVRLKTLGTNTVTIYSVSAYQPCDDTQPDITDTRGANPYIGVDDYPDDVFAMKILSDNVKAVRGYKVPRSNVFNHWYREYHKTAAAYGGADDDLGNYKFVKRADVSEVQLHVLALKSGANNPTLRAEITGTTNAIAAQTSAVNHASLDAGGGASNWITLTFTFTGADVTSEVECGLIIDGKDDPAGTATILVCGLYLVETEPSTSITHTVPNTTNTPGGSIINSSWANNVRDTCEHLWYYGGRAICLADWRFTPATDQVFAATTAVFAKEGYGQTATVIGRAILYSSKNSERLRCRLGCYTSSGTTQTKGINIQTSEHNTDHSDQIDADPHYDDNTNNDYQSTAEFTDERIFECDLDIRDADQEEHYDGVNEPPQVWFQAATTDPSEYVLPTFVSCEEVRLSETEFP